MHCCASAFSPKSGGGLSYALLFPPNTHTHITSSHLQCIASINYLSRKHSMTKYYHLALDPYMACEISCPQNKSCQYDRNCPITRSSTLNNNKII